MTKNGFTLVELIIYIAIVSIVLIMVVSIGQNLVLTNIKAEAEHQVTVNARASMYQISQKIRQADGVITASSTFNAHPGAFTLDYPGFADIVVDTYTKDITLPKGGAVTIRKLRMKEGTGSYQDLTSDQVDVANFVVRNLTLSTEPENINIELTLNSFNLGSGPDYEGSITLETAVSLRK